MGTDVAVTPDLSGLALDNSNYYIGGVTTALKARITPKPVTIGGLTASNKVYNATTVATLTGTPVVTAGDLLGGDTATISGAVTVGIFDSVNAGSGIGVNANISGLAISNPNYYVTRLATPLRANITPAPITVSVVKSYDGGVTVTFDQMTVTGIAGQTLLFAPGSVATISSSAVGSASFVSLSGAVLLDGTGLESNYTVVSPSFSSITISPKALTISGATVANKMYDGTTAATIYGGSLVGVVSGDSVVLSEAGSFISASAGTGIAVTPAYAISGSSAANYTIVQPAGLSADITPLPVIASDRPPTPVVQIAISAAVLREIMEDHIQFILPAMSFAPSVDKLKLKNLDEASGADAPLQSQGGSASCSSAEDGKAASCTEN